ncbi:NADP-reducing hydrogenase subunit HndA [bioreactor metagenome]|jgi:NADH-quinone oxidoreductase subunit E|uniref:NADP-reducing hydrogenase subunit HndA n=1 Tax=bioreactor metagenome TaxID=1076179 RepID=A0A644YMF1_9ZZZZ|nr:NAD(P)H-dependent oxidoreductase subunit E [Paludibacter sp.]
MEAVSPYVVAEPVLDQIVEQYRDRPGMLLSTLEAVQEANPLKFLPVETLVQVSRKLSVPMTQVYSVATFYSFFNLKPQGRHAIVVCRGTACHTKGSRELLNSVGHILGFGCEPDEMEQGYTTSDNEFTIKTVACFGQCAQAPVIAVDGVIHSNVNAQKLIKILKKVKSS